MSTGITQQRHRGNGGGELSNHNNFAVSQTSGEIDVQIATAKRFPRSIKQFRERALSLATLDEETAGSCFYTLPPRGDDDKKPIQGPSIRLAEIVAASWGNIRAQACIVDDDGEFLTAQGRCWDLENNVAIAVDVRRRVIRKNGTRYTADMVNTTANAACSIALRNSVLHVVPMALVKPIYDAAKKVAIGDATTLAKRRAEMVGYFSKMGVKPEQVFAAVCKTSIDDVTIDDLVTLRGYATAIKDGDSTVDEVFPVAAKPGEKKPESKSASDKLADTIGPKAEATALNKAHFEKCLQHAKGQFELDSLRQEITHCGDLSSDEISELLTQINEAQKQ